MLAHTQALEARAAAGADADAEAGEAGTGLDTAQSAQETEQQEEQQQQQEEQEQEQQQQQEQQQEQQEEQEQEQEQGQQEQEQGQGFEGRSNLLTVYAMYAQALPYSYAAIQLLYAALYTIPLCIAIHYACDLCNTPLRLQYTRYTIPLAGALPSLAALA